MILPTSSLSPKGHLPRYRNPILIMTEEVGEFYCHLVGRMPGMFLNLLRRTTLHNKKIILTKILLVPKLRNPKLDHSYKHTHTNACTSLTLKATLPWLPDPFQRQPHFLLLFTTKVPQSLIYSDCVDSFPLSLTFPICLFPQYSIRISLVKVTNNLHWLSLTVTFQEHMIGLIITFS